MEKTSRMMVNRNHHGIRLKTKHLVFLIILQIIYKSCTPGPDPIIFGQDQCTYCKMIISEPGYGAELVTIKSKIYKFDSIECLGAFYLKQDVEHDQIHSMWTVDFDQTKELTEAERGVYLHSDRLHSPMGLNLTAFRDRSVAEDMQLKYGGKLLSWQEVQDLIRKSWIEQ